MADPGPWASLNLGTPPGGGYGPRSLGSGTYGTLARGLMLTAPRQAGIGLPAAGMGVEAWVSSPEPAGGVSVTPGTRQARPRPQGNRPGRAAWFMHTRRRAGLNPSVTRSGSSRFGAGARTGIQGGYGTGESSGRRDKGQGGRSPGVVRRQPRWEPHGYTTFQVLPTYLNNGKDATEVTDMNGSGSPCG